MKGSRVNTNDCKIRSLESIDNRKEKQHAIFKFHINHKSLKGKDFFFLKVFLIINKISLIMELWDLICFVAILYLVLSVVHCMRSLLGESIGKRRNHTNQEN